MSAIKQYPQKQIALGKLHGADYNPREMSSQEMQKLVRSLAEFGIVEPLVARVEDAMIIGGHQRHAAIKLFLAGEGLSTDEIAAYKVPVVMVEGITDERAKLLNLALNKISGEWDYVKLADIFRTLEKLGTNDLTLSAFDSSEVTDILRLMPQDTGALDAVLSSQEAAQNDADVDAALAAQKRRFLFLLDTDEDAALVRDALTQHGMVSPKQPNAALMAIIRNVLGLPQPEPPKGKRASKSAPKSKPEAKETLQ